MKGYNLFCEAVKPRLLHQVWRTEAMSHTLGVKHRDHASYTRCEAQRPRLIYWFRSTEVMPPSLGVKHRGHASFTGCEAQRSHLLHWVWSTEAMPPLLGLKGWGHISFTRKLRGHMSFTRCEAEDTPPLMCLKHWGHTFFTGTYRKRPLYCPHSNVCVCVYSFRWWEIGILRIWRMIFIFPSCPYPLPPLSQSLSFCLSVVSLFLVWFVFPDRIRAD